MELFATRLGVGPCLEFLLVEDDPDDRALFCLAARKTCLNLRIQAVTDGEQAMECLRVRREWEDAGRERLPDVVVLDLRLPVMGGLELLGWCKGVQRFRELPVVVMSGWPLKLWEAEAKRLGADRCFEKPGRPRELVQVVHEVWELARVRSALASGRAPLLLGGSGVGATHRHQVPYSE